MSSIGAKQLKSLEKKVTMLYLMPFDFTGIK